MLKSNYLDNIQCIVFDLDGTIYFGSKLAEKANEVIQLARLKAKNIFFVTNNSAKTRVQIYEKLVNLGIDVELNEVINSGYAIAKYLKDNDYSDIYCLGTKNLANEISRIGINTYSTNPQAIVIGYDVDFNLSKMENILNLKNTDYKIIIANQERTYPRDGATITPGAGAIVASVEYTLNRKTDLVIGKPNPLMLEIITKDFNIDANNVLVVGDSYESDIKMADAFGAKSILVTNTSKTDYSCTMIKDLKDILELL